MERNAEVVRDHLVVATRCDRVRTGAVEDLTKRRSLASDASDARSYFPVPDRLNQQLTL